MVWRISARGEDRILFLHLPKVIFTYFWEVLLAFLCYWCQNWSPERTSNLPRFTQLLVALLEFGPCRPPEVCHKPWCWRSSINVKGVLLKFDPFSYVDTFWSLLRLAKKMLSNLWKHQLNSVTPSIPLLPANSTRGVQCGPFLPMPVEGRLAFPSAQRSSITNVPLFLDPFLCILSFPSKD